MFVSKAAAAAIKHIGVVIPVHNEAEHLPACLTAIASAAARVSVSTSVVVVLDSCTDASDSVVQAAGRSTQLSPVVVRRSAHAVGTARKAGAAALLRNCARVGQDARQVWIANTDADSVVPASWLRSQLAYAAAGSQLVAGTVRVSDWSQWPADVRMLYLAGYESSLGRPTGHGHVHGANLGMRADVYMRAGGFADVAHDEDVGLVRRAIEQGVPITWAEDITVETSSRPRARAPLGFAGHLQDLEALTQSADVPESTGSTTAQASGHSDQDRYVDRIAVVLNSETLPATRRQ